MLIEIWSDVVCPWCYIGKRQFDEALRRVEADPAVTTSVDVVFRSYQLDPRAPLDEVTPVLEAYARKFGGPERAEQIIEHVTQAAAAVGIEFNMDRALRANTVLAHRLLWITLRDHGPSGQATVKEALMRAYFTQGLNIADIDTITTVASTALHPDDVSQSHAERDRLAGLLAVGEGSGEVSEQLTTAAAHGITAVPTFVINGQWSIPGAQDADTFERVIRRLLDSPGG